MNGILKNTDGGWFVFTTHLFIFVLKYRLHPSDIIYIQKNDLSKNFNNKTVNFSLTKKIFDNPMLSIGIKRMFAKLDDENFKI